MRKTSHDKANQISTLSEDLINEGSNHNEPCRANLCEDHQEMLQPPAQMFKRMNLLVAMALRHLFTKARAFELRWEWPQA